jgi:Fe-S cluster assembly protein SufB
MAATQQTIETLRALSGDYKYGFVTDIESDLAPKGLNEDTVRFISAKKGEPQWLLDWRLKAFRIWQQEQEQEPTWARVTYPKIDYQEIYYYAAPKGNKQPESLNEVDPELLKTYEKLGIPLGERAALDFGSDQLQGQAQGSGDHLLPDLRSGARASGAGAQIPRQCRAI